MTAAKALAKEATGPLKGIRILDMTSVVNGAYATQILGDQGAEIIKVEDPGDGRSGGGDITRHNGAPADAAAPGLGPTFLMLNRNKRSIVLNLREPRDLAALKRVIRTCDALVASVRYEGLKRLGLSHEAVAEIRPDIVYAHASGYDSDGPYAGDPAYDDLIQAQAGMADLLPRTHAGMAPTIAPSLIADKVSGILVAQAVTAALVHRARTGEGQFVEVPMFECMTSFNLVEHMYQHVYDPPRGEIGYGRVLNPYRKPYATKDGYIGILPYTDRQWDQFFEAAGFGPAVSSDPRFSDFVARNANIRALYALVEQAAATKTTQEWLDLLRPLSVPVARMNRLDELQDDPQLQAVELFQRYEHPDAGPYKAVRPPVKFSKTPSTIHRHAPRLGEHTAEVLAEVGGEDE
jgi:crotonobetainyl-CoA:carnitine CoA-transferase CaiB-like acyl-CoA transferase